MAMPSTMMRACRTLQESGTTQPLGKHVQSPPARPADLCLVCCRNSVVNTLAVLDCASRPQRNLPSSRSKGSIGPDRVPEIRLSAQYRFLARKAHDAVQLSFLPLFLLSPFLYPFFLLSSARVLAELAESEAVPTILSTTDLALNDALESNAAYFLKHVERINARGYTPTVNDVLHVCQRTESMNSVDVVFGAKPFQVIDVAGQRDERFNWVMQAELNCILFVSSLAGYI